jgi:hypothetical protein
MHYSILSNLEILHDRITNIESIIHKRFISCQCLDVECHKSDHGIISNLSSAHVFTRITATQKLNDMIIEKIITWIKRKGMPNTIELLIFRKIIADFKGLCLICKEEITFRINTDKRLQCLPSDMNTIHLKRQIINEILKLIDYCFRYHDHPYFTGLQRDSS